MYKAYKQELNLSEIENKLRVLNSGESLLLSLDEELSKKFKYITFKSSSIETLFRTCVINNSDISSSINIEKVLELFTQNEIDKNDLRMEIFISALGYKLFEQLKINNKFVLNMDLDINKVIVSKR